MSLMEGKAGCRHRLGPRDRAPPVPRLVRIRAGGVINDINPRAPRRRRRNRGRGRRRAVAGADISQRERRDG